MKTATAPTLKQVETTVRLQLGLDTLAPSDHLTEALGAASADIVNMVASLEETFGIEIDDTDLADLYTVEDLHRIAAQKWETHP